MNSEIQLMDSIATRTNAGTDPVNSNSKNTANESDLQLKYNILKQTDNGALPLQNRRSAPFYTVYIYNSIYTYLHFFYYRILPQAIISRCR
jgi:hypothetical protein